MRLLKECFLTDVPVGNECLVDGAWYKVLDQLIGTVHLELRTEYYKAEDEVYYLDVGDSVYYRSDLKVITEVQD